MDALPGLEKDNRTDRENGDLFDVSNAVENWAHRVMRARGHSWTGSFAIQARAEALLKALQTCLFDESDLCLAQPQLPRLNFKVYSLADVLLELRALRDTCLEIFPDAELIRQKIRDFFENEMILQAGIASVHVSAQLSVQLADPQVDRALESPKDTFALLHRIESEIIGAVQVPVSKSGRSLNQGYATLLLEASKVISDPLEADEILQRIASMAVKTIADWCIVDAVDGTGSFQRVTVLHESPEKQKLADELCKDFAPHERARGIPSHVLRTHESLLIPRVTDAHFEATVRSPRHEYLLRELGSETYMCVPLIARGNFLGAITFVGRDPAQVYNEEDLLFAEELCSRAALAVDNALLLRRAQDATRLREELIGMVSHDLKTPLQAVEMCTSLLLRQIDSPRPSDHESKRRLLETSRDAGRRMSRLINDLLDLSKYDAGQFSIEPVTHQLEDILQEVIDSFHLQAAVKPLQLEFVANGSISLLCDRDRIFQAVMNLVSNAIKFTPAGGRVRLSMASDENDAFIHVEDTGPGIPQEDVPKLFDRFWQGGSHGPTGSGLGLSIVKAMVGLHGGVVDVESRMGGGSRFHIRIPLTRENKEGEL